jgi:hypothetical protein
MVPQQIPIAFSPEKITEFENIEYDVKIDILNIEILETVILNQLILIHKLQYFFSFKQYKYHFTINNFYKHCKIIHTN